MREIFIKKIISIQPLAQCRRQFFCAHFTILKQKGAFTMATENLKTRIAYRQGELLFIPINEEEMSKLSLKPGNIQSSPWKMLGSNVLREGEATGHKHEVLSQTQGTATLLAPERQFFSGLPDMDIVGNEDRLLVADEPVEVVHPEHKSLRLPKGNYLVVVQREYDEVRARRIRD